MVLCNELACYSTGVRCSGIKPTSGEDLHTSGKAFDPTLSIMG